MSYAAQALNRAGKLVVLMILLAVLVAILFGSLSLMLPRDQWTAWRVAILIAAGGAVAVMTAWSSRSPMRPWFMDGLAAVLSLTSAIPGIGMIILVAYGLSLHIAEHKGSGQSLMFQMTNPMLLWHLIYFAMIPAVPGVVGLWIARRRLREAGACRWQAWPSGSRSSAWGFRRWSGRW